MSDKKNNQPNQNSRVLTNDDKGLTPVSSGTPMPKVKPVAQNQNERKK
ncbi:hypothetical protein [Photobacterium leiognathi]|nr:hypothetical protein [Photobacterium leiognathi]